MNEWVIIADDLTGAADAAAGFAAGSEAPGPGAVYSSVVVVVDAESGWPEARVVAVNSETRHLPAGEAERLVGRATARAAAAQGSSIYKKIDSLARGNVAAELRGMLRALRSRGDRPIAIVAPAFPALGRCTIDGTLVADGVPLADFAAVLSGGGLRFEVIRLGDYAGAGELAERFSAVRESGADAAIVDASSDADLGVVALAIAATRGWGIPVGSGGLATQLARRASAHPAGVLPFEIRERGILFVIGSYSEASRLQLAALRDAGVAHVELDHGRLGSDHGIAEVLDGLRRGHAVLSPSLAAVIDERHAAEIADGLAHVVATALPEVTTVVVSGGHTTRAILDRLGVASFRIIGEVRPGVVLNELPGRPQRLITKSGSFGDSQSLAWMLRGQTATDLKGTLWAGQ
jgi:uncharacterized protein YgbK (DUF1537 family)